MHEPLQDRRYCADAARFIGVNSKRYICRNELCRIAIAARAARRCMPLSNCNSFWTQPKKSCFVAVSNGGERWRAEEGQYAYSRFSVQRGGDRERIGIGRGARGGYVQDRTDRADDRWLGVDRQADRQCGQAVHAATWRHGRRQEDRGHPEG